MASIVSVEKLKNEWRVVRHQTNGNKIMRDRMTIIGEGYTDFHVAWRVLTQTMKLEPLQKAFMKPWHGNELAVK